MVEQSLREIRLAMSAVLSHKSIAKKADRDLEVNNGLLLNIYYYPFKNCNCNGEEEKIALPIVFGLADDLQALLNDSIAVQSFE